MADVRISGGDKWKKHLEKYREEPELHVGILSGATYQGEGDAGQAGKKVAEVAYWQEYGTFRNGAKHIPPRPFFRNTIEEKKEEWVQAVASEVKRGQSLEQALTAVGDNITADIVDTIKQGIEPALSETTLANRKKKGHTSTTPLMDSMTLIKTIDFEIKK